MSRAIITGLTVALFACSSLSPQAVPGDECGLAKCMSFDAATTLVLDNRTGADVRVTVRRTSLFQIDRKVLTGEIVVPIGPASSGTERSFSVAPDRFQTLDDGVDVRAPTITQRKPAAVLRIDDGPMILAVGTGRLLVRARDGANVLEAEDPRAVTVLPVERELASCEAGTFGTTFDATPRGIGELDVMSVMSVTRDGDAESCRILRLRHADAPPGADAGFDYRLCVPDAAFPFTDDGTLKLRRIIPEDTRHGGYGIRIENAAGDAVDLVRMRLFVETTATIEGAAIDFAEEPTCVAIDEASCRDVVVPAKIDLAAEGEARAPMAIGEARSLPGSPDRSIVLVGASARPILTVDCASRGMEPADAAQASFAVVTRAPK
jgi:hypothetical protein